MKKIAITACLATALAVPMSTGAEAGSTTLRKGAQKMKLWCNGSGCYTKVGKSRKRVGPGGSANFSKQRKRYRAVGWK